MPGFWKKVIGPVVSIVTTGLLYLNRSTIKKYVARAVLVNPGTTVMALMVLTDPLVIRIAANVALLSWRGTVAIIENYY